MHTFRFVAAILLVLFGAFVAVMNAGCVIATSRNRARGSERHHSTVPLISLLATGAAYVIFPFGPKNWIWLIPAFDVGNWLLAAMLPLAIARGAFEKYERVRRRF